MHQSTQTPIVETKAFETGDPVADVQRVFAAFRETNDERLAQIERRLSADVVTEEKLARIDRALDETKQRIDLEILRRARPAKSGEAEDDPQGREHKAAFRSYMRTGDAGELAAFERKALSAGSGPDGGFLVPHPAEREILQRMAAISPVRALATVMEISGPSYRRAYTTTPGAAGWVGEADARPVTNSPILADMVFPTSELYAMPSATQTLLDDAALDIESWLAGEIETVFAEQESQAFVAGDGVKRPTGFLNYTKSTVAAWQWGRTAYVHTGVAGAFPAANPLDIFVDLVYALRAGYRQNASFMMSRRTQSLVRKMKTTTGEYLWQPPAGLRQPATL
ncbi:MAG TPA: phage major capsid protein, partial [Beijerinckiaceae bacterium]